MVAAAVVKPGDRVVLPLMPEMIRNSYHQEYEVWQWNGRNHLVYRYRWVNQVEIRDSKESLPVNYLNFEIENEER